MNVVLRNLRLAEMVVEYKRDELFGRGVIDEALADMGRFGDLQRSVRERQREIEAERARFELIIARLNVEAACLVESTARLVEMAVLV